MVSLVNASWLVGGFKHLDYFPFHIWDVILPKLTFTPSFFQGGEIAAPTRPHPTIPITLW